MIDKSKLIELPEAKGTPFIRQIVNLLNQHEIELQGLRQELEALKSKSARQSRQAGSATKTSVLKAAFQVKVDPELEELIPTFLENRKKEIIMIQANLKKKDFSAIALQGHNLKGVGDTFGFEVIADKGRQIEREAQKKNDRQIQHHLHELAEYLEQVNILT
ncbi:MAG: hypothetical protein COB67_03380 [SAR324 cluster bacterium]|uniref:HPt domain-containing protein n=1 Tax=SAR324 cluster bacterium TaxID=2024889 RepID=A0A2A4T8Y0_9DELT|nr:MAG: hypothetical protein COB67_03380 [SAR324 cluster bacterium]